MLLDKSAQQPAFHAHGGAELRAFVRAHEVCWDSSPRYVRRRGERLRVGYLVLLYGRHPLGLAADPGGDESRCLLLGLTALARSAASSLAPPDGVVCRIAARPGRFVLRPENAWVPEMEVRLEVLQSAATFAEANDAQEHCLRAIEGRLNALGARERRWARES